MTGTPLLLERIFCTMIVLGGLSAIIAAFVATAHPADDSESGDAAFDTMFVGGLVFLVGFVGALLTWIWTTS